MARHSAALITNNHERTTMKVKLIKFTSNLYSLFIVAYVYMLFKLTTLFIQLIFHVA